MKAIQYPWYNKQKLSGDHWKVTLDSNKKEILMAIPIQNLEGLSSMEIEILWDCFNKDSNFEVDWSLEVLLLRGWYDQELIEKDDRS